MTVLDFRSGGYADPRDGYAAQADEAHTAHWQSNAAVPGWRAEDDWDETQAAGADSMRLTDRPGMLAGMARLTHYVGALVSVVLMAALAIWGYQLVVRDVSGVPVIRAVEGDSRVAPDEPGGELTERTGLAVNNVAAGEKTNPAQQVAIAPAPTALDGQDVAMGELGATAQAPVAADEAPAPEPQAPVVAMTDAEAARLAEQQSLAGAEPVAEIPAVTDAQAPATQEAAITAALAEAGAVPSVTTPTRPLPRPQRIAAATINAEVPAPMAADAPPSEAAAVEAVAEPQDEPAPVPVTAVASGAPLVQIGAFDSTAIAQSEWSRVSGRYSDLFSGKAPVVQEHKAGGRVFYRLRVAGFGSRDDARKFCAALIAAGADCIPAVAK